MTPTQKIIFEPVRVENILQVETAEYIGEDNIHYKYRAISSMDTLLGRRMIRGQKVRIVFELMEDATIQEVKK